MNQIIIREVSLEDLDQLSSIENQCFPEAEAASRETLEERLRVFTDCFLGAEADGRLVGFINGCSTDSRVIFDELYHNTGLHKPEGETLTVFGLDVVPEYQKRGIAAELLWQYIERAKAAGKKRVVLTCKDHLVHYYEKFGFINNGISGSTHGGAVWYDMTLNF
ncbi:GNAT family N-acetyltransferase [Sinanaerobacter chloroacetimidivorans]|jgi:predicted N-acetyltransferase YhbS|uniref:GNAT family N-acetyltransferase n=1 Tax=Sinanaerobacter chloroacetimidivorans TaxID=2818044 RepID=A0A8J8B534_9FIRM|nr:GNAT family N-acetyltransferase [Sinanaerobacter chloroacetimidivorans]MBR0599950.1 GNAT family N-acetyltransferase [Sinanaerobacter chloroacetimidivorans]